MVDFSRKSTKSSGMIASSLTDMIARDVGIENSPSSAYPANSTFSPPGKDIVSSGAMDAIAGFSKDSEVVISVSLDIIDPNPQNSRARYIDDEISEMWDAIQRADGTQLIPIILMPSDNAPGRFWCIDGMTRVMALKLGGRSEVMAVIRKPSSPLQRYVSSYLTNNAHRKTTDFDDGISWTRMMAAGDMIYEDITFIVGANRAPLISRILSIGKLPEEIQNVISMNHEKLTCNFFYRIHQLLSRLTSAGVEKSNATKKCMDILIMVVGDDLSIRQLDSMIAIEISKAEEEFELKPKKDIDKSSPFNSRFVQRRSIEIGGTPVGHIREWSTGKIEIKVSERHAGLSEAIKLKIAEAISEYSNKT